jgi:hypothetical protein
MISKNQQKEFFPKPYHFVIDSIKECRSLMNVMNVGKYKIGSREAELIGEFYAELSRIRQAFMDNIDQIDEKRYSTLTIKLQNLDDIDIFLNALSLGEFTIGSFEMAAGIKFYKFFMELKEEYAPIEIINEYE